MRRKVLQWVVVEKENCPTSWLDSSDIGVGEQANPTKTKVYNTYYYKVQYIFYNENSHSKIC